MSDHPHFGHTLHGLPVHLRTADYHHGKHGEFNRKVALWLTSHVGSMRCFWAFAVIALLSLPATLHLAGFHLPWLYGALPAIVLTFGWIEVDAWVTQNFIQLVLLPALLVGQNLQNDASDARSAKQLEDLEQVRNWLDLRIEGGLTAVLDGVNSLDGRVADLAQVIQQVMAARAEHDSVVASDAKAARTAAESAFVATQALAAVATGPQPVLKDTPPGAKGKP